MSVFPQKQRVPTSKCLTCGKGWIEFESFCFFLSRERHTWSESRVDCQNRGGDLAILDQDRVKNFLSQKSKDLYWIGLNRSPSGVWAWVDGSALGKSNWSKEPGQADCVYMDGEGDQSWRTSKCSYVSFYICQKNR
ncbi:CD209 antigen-like protein A [Clupea harengus]|uniref:CD209 antigen-like protein A n=1 Tax=Clupea harengus TaxID=7950 RepID=A0A6P8GTD2_CLUHA|nr:CD209 antigen-like protein A [Clupea harengus]